MSTQTTRRATLVAGLVLLMMASGRAYAVWNESIRIVGDSPVPAGATVSLALASGDVVEGQVREDDDGQVLVFVLPGDSPVAGTLRIATSSGENAYALPPHGRDAVLTLALSDAAVGMVAERDATADTYRSSARRWSYGVGVGYAYYATEYFDAVIDANEQELVDILNGFGGTGVVTDATADDSSSGYTLSLFVRRSLGASGNVYFEVGYSDLESFSGRIDGAVDVAGNVFSTLAEGKSELDIVTAALGYERQIGSAPNWRWYTGAGAMWTDLEDQSRTIALINGMEVSAFESSTSDDDTAAFIEAGVRYSIPVRAYRYDIEAEVSRSNEIFAGEALTRFQIGLSLVY